MKNANDLVVKNLKALIEKSGKSKDLIGRESETRKSTISKILAGKLNPSVKVLGNLADYFEVDIREFFKP